MKRNNVLRLAFAMSLVFGSACTSQQDFNTDLTTQSPWKERSQSLSETSSLEERYHNIDVYQLVRENHELFEDVIIFDSIGQVDQLLEELLNMNYEELRGWCNYYDFHNTCLESHIIYDSLWCAAKQQLGYDIEDKDLSFEEYDEIYEEFLDLILPYSDLFTFQEDSEFGICVSKLSDFQDIDMFCNADGIVIIDKVVFLFRDGFLLTCPIDEYLGIPENANMSELYAEYIDGEDMNGPTICMAPIKDPQETVLEDINTHIASRGNYKLSIYICAYPYWGWFKTNIRGKAIIENYYKGSKRADIINGSIYFGVKVSCPGEPTEYYDNIFAKRVDGQYKTNTYTETLYRTNYLPTKKTVVELRNVDIYVIQQGGDITISYKH